MICMLNKVTEGVIDEASLLLLGEIKHPHFSSSLTTVFTSVSLSVLQFTLNISLIKFQFFHPTRISAGCVSAEPQSLNLNIFKFL